jgi:hypothetical protein
MKLDKLHSLVLRLANVVKNLQQLFDQIFRLPKLKYCRISYPNKDGQYIRVHFAGKCIPSTIERLVIDSRFRYDSLENLLFRVPNLRHLSINYLVGHADLGIYSFSTPLTQLKHVSLKLLNISVRQLEPLITNCFQHVELLRLTTSGDLAYLNAKQWKKLIASSMPCLRIFDINHQNDRENEPISYHIAVNEFESPFWTERRWCFASQHILREDSVDGRFYLRNPYR